MQNKNAASTYRPGDWALDHDIPAGQAGAKSPPLQSLYPEKDQYLIIPAKRYYDREFAEQEWQKVWARTWNCAGLTSDIPKAGDWFKYELGHESIIVVRQADTSIKAFYNVCKHRGRSLVTADFGHANSFVCPFHSWSYNQDGSNRRVTDREYFDERALCGELSLREIRCDQWSGFVFVNLDAKTAPLQDFLDVLPTTLDAYSFDTMRIVKDVSIELPCNWKLAMEAFLEPYHAHITHSQILPVVDELYNQYDFFRNGHALVVTPVGLPSPRFKDQDSINPALAYLLLEAGIDPQTFEGTAQDVRAAIWNAKRDDQNTYGLDYRSYSDSQLTDDWNPNFFPNMTFNAHPEGTMVMRFLPHASDPTRCHYNVWILLPTLREGMRPPAYMGVEDNVEVSGKVRPARRYTHLEDPQLGEVLEQDIANLIHMQQGVMSRGMSEGIRLGELEQRIQQVHAEIDRCIARQ
jgi:phenylpropionate dioxygenase-like ring-hydroxylating dioxygenase large terminal subunit